VERDFVDWVLARWRAERPDLDVSSIAVAGRLARVARLQGRRLERVCRDIGVNLGELSVLTTLRRAGQPHHLTPSELYRATMVTSGAMTKRIDHLLALGLVERVRDPRDARSVRVGLTPAGLDFVDAAVGPYLEAEREVVAALTAEEQVELARLLRKLLLALEGTAATHGAGS